MIKLGCLKIFDNESLIEARKKIRLVSVKLNCSDIFATRIEAVLSEAFRIILKNNSYYETELRLLKSNEKYGMEIFIKNIKKCQNISFLEEFFDMFSTTYSEKNLCTLSAFIFLEKDINSLNESFINELISDLSVKTREELIKEIKSKNRELAESRMFMQSVLENIQAAVYVKDMKGRYTFVNTEWENATGQKRDFIIGKTSYEIFPGKDGELFHKNDMRIINSNNEEFSEEYSMTGSEKKIYLSCKVPMKQENKITGLCSISTDITLRKKMEEELINAKKAAEDAAKAKADFLANMSHEIRTPMNAILGMAYLIKKPILMKNRKII